MTGRAAELTAVVSVAAILTLAIGASVLQAPSARLFGAEIAGRHHDPFTVMQQFGRPMATGVYTQPFTDLPGAWLARAAGPVAAYNWIVLLSFPLSAAAAFLLARHLGLGRLTAALAAMAFAFSPFHLAQAAYHPHIAQTHWVPLYLFALWRCLDKPTPAAAGLLVLAGGGAALSNFYGGLIAAVITPVAAGAYWFVRSRGEPGRHRRLAIAVLSVGLIATGGLAYAWYAAPAVLGNADALAFPREDLFRYSAKWWAYLVPPLQHPVVGEAAGRLWRAAGVDTGLLEQQVSLGVGIVALGLVAVGAWVVRERQPAPLALVPVLVLVAAVALVCSLSPERTIGSFTFSRPSALLYTVVPMFRSYARFGVVVQLMAVLLAAIGAERLWHARALGARFACAALVALGAAEYAVWPPSLSRDVLPTPAHRWIMEQPDATRVLDCAPLTPASASVPWLSAYRIALLGGNITDCSEPNLGAKLSAAGYTHLLVHEVTRDAQWFRGRGTRDGLESRATFDGVEVFAVTGPPPPVFTARMTAFHPREYDEAWSWRWMGHQAAWTIVNTTERTLLAMLDIQMTAFNGGGRLQLVLDGVDVQTVAIDTGRVSARIGPLALTPGNHQLLFRSANPPTMADELLHNGDRRALSFAIGGWRWVVEGNRP